ncbi:MAG: ion transporter [Xenococcaceae cyanobacterium MO_234.B1]|nr:ion transporter [Xenococcaceae cyanobacterium MO_234.B1]
MSSLKEKIAFYLEDIETPIGLVTNLLILFFILLSAGIFVIETYPINSEIQDILHLIDLGILVVFTFEYILRFWSANNKLKFFFRLFSVIDLIAILPLVLGLMDTTFIRIFRWFRILRIIRFWKLEILLLGIKADESIVFVRIFLTLFSLIFVYAGLIYQVEHSINQVGLKNFFDAFYFVVVTMTTVGYGDVTPLSEPGRAMTLLMILTGVLFIPWQLSELIKQVLKTVNVVEIQCKNCNLSRHDPDAQFCKQCGTKLYSEEELEKQDIYRHKSPKIWKED